MCCPFSENIYSLVGNKCNNICFIVPEMSAERRYFEEEEHVALYAASRPTVPHSLLQDIIQYCNRIAQSLIYINMNFFSKLYFFFPLVQRFFLLIVIPAESKLRLSVHCRCPTVSDGPTFAVDVACGSGQVGCFGEKVKCCESCIV